MIENTIPHCDSSLCFVEIILSSLIRKCYVTEVQTAVKLILIKKYCRICSYFSVAVSPVVVELIPNVLSH